MSVKTRSQIYSERAWTELSKIDLKDEFVTRARSFPALIHNAGACQAWAFTCAKEWAVLGLNLLQEALMNWGFGGKINAGYGRMVSDDFMKNLAAEKQKAELSEMPFAKVGDVSLGIVKMDGGRKVEVAGKGELPCKSYPSAKVGMTAKIKAIEWPKKKPLPTMCEIIEVL